MLRLVLVRHARTDAVRTAGFPAADDSLDASGRAAARAAAAGVAAAGWARDEIVTSPLARAVETAKLLGLAGRHVDPAIGEADFGRWSGRTLAAVSADDPRGVARWMEDPAAAPHGGESLRDVRSRVGAWLDGLAGRDARLLAVTHGGVVKAAIVHALGAPDIAFWRIDCAPLHATELHGRDGRWTVASVNVRLSTDPQASATPPVMA